MAPALTCHLHIGPKARSLQLLARVAGGRGDPPVAALSILLGLAQGTPISALLGGLQGGHPQGSERDGAWGLPDPC